MDRRSFLKTVGRAAAVAGAARSSGALIASAHRRDGAPHLSASMSGGSPVAPERVSSGVPDPAAHHRDAASPDRLTLIAAGDCLLSRRVSGLHDPEFLTLVELLRDADCVWGNCEIVLGNAGELYPGWKDGDPHSIGEPWSADEFHWLGFRLMGTANNHTLDFGNEGLMSTLAHLDRVGIAHAGSGVDLERAARPGFVDTDAGRIGLVNCASTFLPYFAAAPAHPYLKGRPGLNPLNVKYTLELDGRSFRRLKSLATAVEQVEGSNDLFAPPPPPPRTFDFLDTTIRAGERIDFLSEADPGDVQRIKQAITIARGTSRIVIASIHAHERQRVREASALFVQPFARACIDAGADVYVSAGPHVLRGIEIYRGKPIFYSLGNFFFQIETMGQSAPEILASRGLDPRSLDPLAYEEKLGFTKQRRFFESLVPRITFAGGKVAAVELFPLSLGFDQPVDRRGTPRLARGEEGAAILRRVAELSAPYGTAIDVAGDVGRVRLS
jgi:poly-gamma-glutamate capsule biosynthesis protein CapA/YwtB (metallophosphatase superfamily)